MLGNFSCFLSPYKFIQNQLFQNTIRVSNGLDPDQGRRYVSPDMGPNCFIYVLMSKASQGAMGWYVICNYGISCIFQSVNPLYTNGFFLLV